MPIQPMSGGRVVEIERIMPAWDAPDGIPVRHRQIWSFAEYAQLIESRFRDLLARESEPKVLPHVMRMWGLEA